MRGKISLLAIFLFLFFVTNSLLVSSQSWLWGKYGVGDGGVFSIATDATGNCYISGLFPYNTVQFGSNILTNTGISNDFNTFLIKYAPNGNIIWAKQTYDINSSNVAVTGAPCSISTDGAGNIYLNGNFPDTLLIGKDTLIVNARSSYASSTFIAKYDSGGNTIWAKEAILKNDSSGIYGKCISSDLKGNTWFAGSFVDTILFEIDTISTPSPNFLSIFLAKYDSNGNLKWAKQSTGRSIYGAAAYSVTSDVFGNSIITGGFEDSVTFGSIKLGSAVLAQSDGSLFIAKYDSNGNALWAKQSIISNVYDGCVGVSVITDNVGNIYVCGNFVNIVTIGSYTLHGTNFGDIFIAKYDPNGNVLWVEQSIGLDSNTWHAWSISIDNAKHLYLAANGGYSRSKIGFGDDTLTMDDTAKYDGASIILKLDSNGNVLCGSIIPGGAIVWNSVSSDTSGKHVYFGATAATPIIFGHDTVNPFSVPTNPLQGLNYFPFVARWQACDTNIFSSVVQKENSEGQVVLYPNPNNGRFIIALKNVNEPTQIEVYNVMGEEIYKAKLNSKNNEINLSDEPEGVYFYRVLNEMELPIGQGKLIIEK